MGSSTMAVTVGEGKRVVVEGSIGVGKTTIIKELVQHCPDFCPFLEPLEDWGSCKILDIVYRDKGSAFLAQSFIAQTLLKRDLPSAPMHQVSLYERSIFSAHHCFIPIMHELDRLTVLEADVLVSLHTHTHTHTLTHTHTHALCLGILVSILCEAVAAS